jgi:hypothetical protein
MISKRQEAPPSVALWRLRSAETSVSTVLPNLWKAVTVDSSGSAGVRRKMACSLTRRRPYIGSTILLLLFAAAGAAAPAQQQTRAADDTFLDDLQGDWMMSGTFRGKPVRYLADGRRVLQGGFLRLHMIDVQAPPQYEADLFIGFDAKANDYIGHWLDRFGAAGARVVGHGERNRQQLVIVFPYVEGAFRDTFSFEPAARSWSLLIESQSADGTWSTFATYSLTRRSHH